MAGSSHTVLVVDDDDDVREMLTELLELEGFEAPSARDGREALDYLRTHEPPCLIVLDLMMPGMSGPEFRAEQLRDRVLCRIPVVVLSAASEGPSQARAMAADGYFTKPVVFEAFLDALRARC